MKLISSIIRTAILVAIISAIISSCVKEEIKPVFDKYEMIVDRYSLDTTVRGSRWIEAFGSIYKPEVRMSFDTCPDRWYIDCSIPDTLQHLYYTKNGKKIQKSTYPK